jgi:hypothetical protein
MVATIVGEREDPWSSITSLTSGPDHSTHSLIFVPGNKWNLKISILARKRYFSSVRVAAAADEISF